MSKKKPTKSKVAEPQIDGGSEIAESTIESAIENSHDRRRDSPLIRLKGRLQDAYEQAKRDLERIERWGSENNTADLMLLKDDIRAAICSFGAAAETCDRLHTTGFEIKRAPSVLKEGDVVAIVGKCQLLYCDVLPIEQMASLKVVKIYPGRGGALVVESITGARQRVAFAHVDRV